MDAETSSASTPSPQTIPAPPQPRAATRLLRETLDATEEYREALQRDLTVNSTDLLAMQHLLTAGPMGPTELSRRLGISAASTTTAVDRLVEVGHVIRQPHPTDRRGIVIVPTDASRAHAWELLTPMLADVDGALDAFSEPEREIIAAYLQRIIEVYRRHATQLREATNDTPAA